MLDVATDAGTANLAAQQTRLLRALWAPRDGAGWQALQGHCEGLCRGPSGLQTGWQAYRGHAAATAERALAAACPTVQAFMGEADFARMARHHWQGCPPTQGDLGAWGEALPAWLAEQASLAVWPCLPELARLDLACRAAERAADAVFDADSLALLAHEDPDRLRLRWASGLQVLRSCVPLAAWWCAHHHEQVEARETAWGLLRAAEGEQGDHQQLVWRQGWRAACVALSPAEAEFIQAQQQGRSLGEALATVKDLDFGDWLGRALGLGWCLGVCPIAQEDA